MNITLLGDYSELLNSGNSYLFGFGRLVNLFFQHMSTTRQVSTVICQAVYWPRYLRYSKVPISLSHTIYLATSSCYQPRYLKATYRVVASFYIYRANTSKQSTTLHNPVNNAAGCMAQLQAVYCVTLVKQPFCTKLKTINDVTLSYKPSYT